MKNLVFLAVLTLAIVGGVGYYLGWFQLTTVGGEHNATTTITVNKDKIHADEARAKEKLQEIEHKK